MARIIHQTPLMKRLLPELSDRISRTPVKSCDLAFETELGRFGLALRNRSVRITPGSTGTKIRLPQRVLTQLIFGYRTALDVAQDEDAHIPRKTIPPLDLLFPKQHSYMWWSDRF